MDFEHIPVLFNETVNSLEIKPDGLYVDCTAGGGGRFPTLWLKGFPIRAGS